ncbi:hypothetical protein [Miltoncostaea oceani]|uniref:hypothetical protein n=1 Tax=Miltoncostaea oceani TaxID=2843216 RepID=UPI001C3CE5A4|nr:hypothetical protein [Miltoncostaea oceani]
MSARPIRRVAAAAFTGLVGFGLIQATPLSGQGTAASPPPCPLAGRELAIEVTPGTLTLAKLLSTDLTASVSICPGEYLSARIVTPDVLLAGDDLDPRFGTDLGATTSDQPATQQGRGAISLRASGNARRQIAGYDSVRVQLVAFTLNAPGADGPASFITMNALSAPIPFVGGPAPLIAPGLRVSGTARLPILNVTSFVPPGLIDRRAVVERRVGGRYVLVRTRPVKPFLNGRFGIVRSGIRLDPERAGGPTGVAGARAVSVRVRILRDGARQPAIGGTPATVRLP